MKTKILIFMYIGILLIGIITAGTVLTSTRDVLVSKIDKTIYNTAGLTDYKINKEDTTSSIKVCIFKKDVIDDCKIIEKTTRRCDVSGEFKTESCYVYTYTPTEINNFINEFEQSCLTRIKERQNIKLSTVTTEKTLQEEQVTLKEIIKK